MPLDLTHLLKTDSWCEARKIHPNKLQQVIWFDKFHKVLYTLKNTSSVSIGYLTNSDITYIEGTPIFHWFKFTKNGFFINHGYDCDDWRNYDDSDSTRNILLYEDINKWPQRDKNDVDMSDYVLFPIQRMSSRFELKLIIEAMRWAKEKKQIIVFRPHPYPVDTVAQETIWNKLKDANLVSDYTLLSNSGSVKSVVDNCKAVWSLNSGVGLQAILSGKPVAYFLKDQDHTYGPIAKFCKTTYDAEDAEPFSRQDVNRYLNWYYNEVILDLKRKDLSEEIQRRIYHAV